jgi:hypothetical protein
MAGQDRLGSLRVIVQEVSEFHHVAVDELPNVTDSCGYVERFGRFHAAVYVSNLRFDSGKF